MKKISILGSTGSIGRNTLEIIDRYPNKFKVLGLAARCNINIIEEQIKTFKPKMVALFDHSAAEELKKRDLPVEILIGTKGVTEIATMSEIDTVVSAIVGSSGLIPTYEAVKAGKKIALANKETMVMAGSIIMETALKTGAVILPVDSEHSAIFQCLNGGNPDEIHRLILTASGGPFLRKSLEELKNVTTVQALNHPNWSMGKKISIDSATLMNKALEVIEARWLFGIPIEKIDVFLHPQSIVHSMVEFIDGSILAQLSLPDMKGPICYALSYPERFENVMPKMQISALKNLTFEAPDKEKYPCLTLAHRSLKAGGTMPSVMNTANEVAVDAFLQEKIPFLDIYKIVAATMDAHEVKPCRQIDDAINAAKWATETATKNIEPSPL